MSGQPVKRLSKNFPIGASIFSVLVAYIAYGLIRGETSSYEPRWQVVLLYLGAAVATAFFISRYWFAPRVKYNTEGVFIKPFRAPEVFVPFKDVTRLQAVNNLLAEIFNKRHKQFDLYYIDAFRAPQKVRIMLHYYQHLFDGEPPLKKFLKYAEEGNPEFVFYHNPYGWPFR